MIEKGMTTTEFAQKAGKSRQYIFKLVKNGTIPAREIGGRYIISKKDAQKLLGNSDSTVDTAFNQAVVDLVFQEYGETMRMLAET